MYSYPARKIVYSGKAKRDIAMPLGGIGTGCIELTSNGTPVNYEIFASHNKMTYSDFAFFAIKAEKNGKICDIRKLMTESECSNVDSYVFPCFPESDFTVSYPFGEIDFMCENFPGKVHLSVWNPLIPLNDTDSGIPAALFEYEVANTTDTEITYTLYGVLNNPFDYSVNRFCKSRNDYIKYIKLTSANEDFTKHGKGELCIGVYGGDIGYQEYLERGERLETLNALLNDINSGDLINRQYEPCADKNDSCAISTKITLKSGESRKVRFVISWYVPYIPNPDNPLLSDAFSSNDIKSIFFDDYNKDKIFRNYYTRYFTGADECIYYCLSQWGRLYSETDAYRQLLFSSTLPLNWKEEVSKGVIALKSKNIVRNYDGVLFDSLIDGQGECNYGNLALSSSASMCSLLYLFPNIVRLSLESFFKQNLQEVKSSANAEVCPDVDTKKILKEVIDKILLLYCYYKLSGNSKWLSEIWNDVIKAIEFVIKHVNQYNGEFINSDFDNKCDYAAMLKAGCDLALAAKDKKHIRKFGELHENANEQLEFDFNYDKIKSCVAKENAASPATLCNIEIDAHNKFYKFCPDMRYAEKDVFRCFVCFEGFMGFVERGVDYIQLNCVKGCIYIRNIEVPLAPLKIKCQGVEIGFTRDGNTAILDNDCEVSPGRNLLVIIPFEKNK